MTLKKETRDKLLNISTATLFTAMFKRGLRNQCLQGVHPVHADLTRKTPNMVGEAYTLRYIPAREDINTMSVFLDRNHPQRHAIEHCPPGSVLVIAHNPGLHELAVGLAQSGPKTEALGRLERKFATTGLARLRLTINDWSKLRLGVEARPAVPAGQLQQPHSDRRLHSL